MASPTASTTNSVIPMVKFLLKLLPARAREFGISPEGRPVPAQKNETHLSPWNR